MGSKQLLGGKVARRGTAAASLWMALSACAPDARVKTYEAEVLPDPEVAVLFHSVSRCGSLSPDCVAGTNSTCAVYLAPGSHEIFLAPLSGGEGQSIRFVARPGRSYSTQCSDRFEVIDSTPR